ncbi:putative alpha/Beta hydrolase [Helianthus anomalus]
MMMLKVMGTQDMVLVYFLGTGITITCYNPYFHCICLLFIIYLSHIFHLTTAINGVPRGLFSEYIKNSRGVQLFTCRWLPLSSPKALVFLCHGYGMECGDFMKVTLNV